MSQLSPIMRTPWESVSIRSDYLAQKIAESISRGCIEIDDTLCAVVDDLQSISASEAPLDLEEREHLAEDDSFDFTPTLLGQDNLPSTAEDSIVKRYQARRYPRLVIV